MVAVFALLVIGATATAAPKSFTHLTTVEGVSEYRLPNGLRILTVPDESVSTFTLNMTVLVGSRHEGYGEKGMAHVLEHMLFKGSPKFKDPKAEMGKRGAEWNGTTREDRTNYFETLPATDANVEFAIRFEADRLVNCFVSKKDLDTEMTVVRNEFERSESNAQRVLAQRVRALAFNWHNYGRSVLGTKADIERVPIENLQAFYKRYYQPDNTILVLAGKYDEAKAFRWIAESFGRIPKPSRVLAATITEEPVQDGERYVAVRRVGGTPALSAVWRIPASSDPDYPALMALQGVLGDQPQGWLHAALVEGKKSASARCDIDDFREPGLFQCAVMLKPTDSMVAVREAFLKVIESPGTISVEELERSKIGWVSQMEQFLERSEGVGLWLSEWAAQGDWRMVYVQRDRLKKVTVDDAQRVWAKYLKPQNRSLGEYHPTEKPDRAEVPIAPDIGPVVATYKGGPAVAKGEAFDTAPAKIEQRAKRFALPNGAKVALLPKKTRAEAVAAVFDLRYGTPESLKGLRAVSELTAAMLNRGTKKLPYKQLRNTLERLRSQISVGGGGQVTTVMLTTQRQHMAEVLSVLADVLKDPGFEASELEVLRAERLANLERLKDEPMAVGSNELRRALAPLSKDHPNYVATFPELIGETKAVTLDQVKAFYSRFYGAANLSVSVVGDFDAAEVERALSSTYGGWSAKERYQLAPDPYVAVPATVVSLATPDKPNAWMGTGTTLKLTDASPDFPAMMVASHLLGGGASSRLFSNLREAKGLSYGAFAYLDASEETDRAVVSSTITYAPANVGAVESAVQAELERWATVAKEELDRARSEILEQRKQGRSDDRTLAHMLAQQSRLGRTMAWEESLDAKVAGLTPEQVSGAVKKLVDPSSLVRVKAGDFKTVVAPK